jgi:hypothetical protein
MRPSENTAPVKKLGSVPQIRSGMPAVTVKASRPANAM